MKITLFPALALIAGLLSASCERPQDTLERIPISDEDTLYVSPSGSVEVTPEGKIHYTIPTVQDGTLQDFSCLVAASDLEDAEALEQMAPPYHVLTITIGEGNYTVKELLIKPAKGELIAGDVTWDLDTGEQVASESEIKVALPKVADASKGDTEISVMLAPVLLTDGFTLGATDADGNYTEQFHGWKMTLSKGGTTDGINVASRYHTQIAFVAGSGLYLVDADLARGKSYKDGLIWKWNSSQHKSRLGNANTNNMDECKIVDGGNSFLVTSSYNWAAIVDAFTGDVLFYSDQSTMAHSAEMLPGGRVAVACSSGGDCLQVFDREKPNVLLYSTPLPFGHGAVWDAQRELLYASSFDYINVYTLKDWDTESPSLSLVKSISTPTGYVHDLGLLDNNTLMVSGSQAFYLNLDTEEFTPIEFFTGRKNLKSVNCNPETGEAWYTQGGADWWTDEIRHVGSFREVSANTYDSVISVNLACYKVRVRQW